MTPEEQRQKAIESLARTDSEQTTDKRNLFQHSIDTQILYEYLITQAPGAFIPYATLNKMLARNVQEDARHCLDAARKRALKTHQLVFKPTAEHPDKGLKCLTDKEKTELGQPAIRAIRRKATRAANEMMAVKSFQDLPADSQIKHNVGLSILGAIRQIGSKKQIDRIETTVTETANKLPWMKTLEAFKKNKSDKE